MTAGRIPWTCTWVVTHPIMTANQFTRIVTTPGLTESMRPSNTE